MCLAKAHEIAWPKIRRRSSDGALFPVSGCHVSGFWVRSDRAGKRGRPFVKMTLGELDH